jgi:hypothetical protein
MPYGGVGSIPIHASARRFSSDNCPVANRWRGIHLEPMASMTGCLYTNLDARCAMENSVAEAKWLLIAVFGLSLLVATAGLMLA